jgi:H+/Cl- antiporter ClcA
MAKPILTEYRGELSFLAFILSMIALVISVPGIFFLDKTPEPMKGFVSGLKAWYLWLLLAGIICGFAGGYYFFTTVQSLRKFKKMMKTATKTQFAKNEPELERLALDLPERYSKDLNKAKREFGTEE